MPPSGFSKIQSQYIVDYLFSCLIELSKEGQKYNFSPEEALRREINNIEEILSSKMFDELSNSLLLLTKNFYIELLEISYKSFETFLLKKDEIAYSIIKRILEIHVPVIK